MDALAWEAEPPELRSPVLVCAFAGWNDAAGSATTALTTAAEALDAEVIAQIDPEEFFDFQANRPTISLEEGQTREIEWPGNVLLAAEPAGAERDLVLLAGTEPSLRWRTFSDGIEELVEQLGMERSSYEGPTGIVGVLHDACRRRGMSSASLWAAVPHYVAAVPNPKAALALLRRLEGLTGIAVEASELEEATGQFEEQVDSAVAANPEIEELVRNLEASQEEEVPLGQ